MGYRRVCSRIMCYKLVRSCRTCSWPVCSRFFGYALLCCRLVCYRLMGSRRMVFLRVCFWLVRFLPVAEPTGILRRPKPHGNASFTMPILQGIRHSKRNWRNILGCYSSYSSLSGFSFSHNSTPPNEVQMKYSPHFFTVCIPLQHPLCWSKPKTAWQITKKNLQNQSDLLLDNFLCELIVDTIDELRTLGWALQKLFHLNYI